MFHLTVELDTASAADHAVDVFLAAYPVSAPTR